MIKLLTESQGFTKIVQVAPPMVKINGPLLGVPILVVLKEFMNNPYLHLISELNRGPTRCNGILVGILGAESFPILGFPTVKGQDHTLLGSGRLLTASGPGGDYNLFFFIIRGRA